MTMNRIACMALLLAGLFWTSHPAIRRRCHQPPGEQAHRPNEE